MTAAAPYDVASLAEARLVPLIQSLARLASERAQERDAAIRERDLAREERDTFRELLKVGLEQLHTVTTLEQRHSLQLARRLGLDEHQHLQWMLANDRFDFREAGDHAS